MITGLKCVSGRSRFGFQSRTDLLNQSSQIQSANGYSHCRQTKNSNREQQRASGKVIAVPAGEAPAGFPSDKIGKHAAGPDCLREFFVFFV